MSLLFTGISAAALAGCFLQDTSPAAGHPVFGEANVKKFFTESPEENESDWEVTAFPNGPHRMFYNLSYDEENEVINFVWLTVGVEDSMSMMQVDTFGRGWLHNRVIRLGDSRDPENLHIYGDINNDGRFDLYRKGSQTFIMVDMTYVPRAKHGTNAGEYVAYDDAGEISHRFVDDVWVEATAKGEGTEER